MVKNTFNEDTFIIADCIEECENNKKIVFTSQGTFFPWDIMSIAIIAMAHEQCYIVRKDFSELDSLDQTAPRDIDIIYTKEIPRDLADPSGFHHMMGSTVYRGKSALMSICGIYPHTVASVVPPMYSISRVWNRYEISCVRNSLSNMPPVSDDPSVLNVLNKHVGNVMLEKILKVVSDISPQLPEEIRLTSVADIIYSLNTNPKTSWFYVDEDVRFLDALDFAYSALNYTLTATIDCYVASMGRE